MNALGAVSTGAGLGLAFYGGLWLMVRRLMLAPHRPVWIVLSRAARWALVGVGFYALTREGAEMVLAGLVDLLLARIFAKEAPGGGS